MAEVQNHAIAVVDDDPLVRRALQRILVAMNYPVAPFDSAEEFLASKDTHRFSCLLLDVQMPGLSGIDLYTRLAAENRTPPVIFISANPDVAHAVARAAGPAILLLKPLDAESLREAINEAISALPTPVTPS